MKSIRKSPIEQLRQLDIFPLSNAFDSSIVNEEKSLVYKLNFKFGLVGIQWVHEYLIYKLRKRPRLKNPQNRPLHHMT